MNTKITTKFIDANNAESPEWAQAKYFNLVYGMGPAQLGRYARDGLIRTTSIRRPGQKRGIRLYSLADMNSLIRNGMENVSG